MSDKVPKEQLIGKVEFVPIYYTKQSDPDWELRGDKFYIIVLTEDWKAAKLSEPELYNFQIAATQKQTTVNREIKNLHLHFYTSLAPCLLKKFGVVPVGLLLACFVFSQ